MIAETKLNDNLIITSDDLITTKNIEDWAQAINNVKGLFNKRNILCTGICVNENLFKKLKQETDSISVQYPKIINPRVVNDYFMQSLKIGFVNGMKFKSNTENNSFFDSAIKIICLEKQKSGIIYFYDYKKMEIYISMYEYFVNEYKIERYLTEQEENKLLELLNLLKDKFIPVYKIKSALFKYFGDYESYGK